MKAVLIILAAANAIMALLFCIPVRREPRTDSLPHGLTPEQLRGVLDQIRAAGLVLFTANAAAIWSFASLID